MQNKLKLFPSGVFQYYMVCRVVAKQSVPYAPPGEVAGVLCAVVGEGMCREVLPYITGGIEGNLERDSGEVDTQLTQKLSQSSSSSSPESSYIEDRTERVSNLGWVCHCTVCVVV